MVATPTFAYPEFTFLFLAVHRAGLSHPCRKAIVATDECRARSYLEPDFILVFAGRLPVQEVRHV
ncbi:host cell division inhibitor Icd-like protein [Dickeya sp. CFBP 2040]|uniref:host cell division inhibitor Icd-like protein n=1 Tax=Dickeya sp. CFBP 2040 TaxID=2718531 RepID=UPI001447B649|nr:host cell division inhibitor Icd-like protein [Dickeya sp. CFBP 2040]NKI75443.1 host cell division inhibitor Icd-like protein [Dickeya sp. CFBP 2040]